MVSLYLEQRKDLTLNIISIYFPLLFYFANKTNQIFCLTSQKRNSFRNPIPISYRNNLQFVLHSLCMISLKCKHLNRAVFGKNCMYCLLQNSWITFSGQIGQIGDSHLYCFQIHLQLLKGASV